MGALNEGARLLQLLQSLQLGLLKTCDTRSWADPHNPPRFPTLGAADVRPALDANKLLMLDEDFDKALGCEFVPQGVWAVLIDVTEPDVGPMRPH